MAELFTCLLEFLAHFRKTRMKKTATMNTMRPRAKQTRRFSTDKEVVGRESDRALLCGISTM